MLHFETERFTLTTKFDMGTKIDNTTESQHDAKLPVMPPKGKFNFKINKKRWKI